MCVCELSVAPYCIVCIQRISLASFYTYTSCRRTFTNLNWMCIWTCDGNININKNIVYLNKYLLNSSNIDNGFLASLFNFTFILTEWLYVFYYHRDFSIQCLLFLLLIFFSYSLSRKKNTAMFEVGFHSISFINPYDIILWI